MPARPPDVVCARTGKIIYCDRAAAEAYIETQRARYPHYHGGVSTCADCGFFHAGLTEGQLMALKRRSGRQSAQRANAAVVLPERYYLPASNRWRR